MHGFWIDWLLGHLKCILWTCLYICRHYLHTCVFYSHSILSFSPAQFNNVSICLLICCCWSNALLHFINVVVVIVIVMIFFFFLLVVRVFSVVGHFLEYHYRRRMHVNTWLFSILTRKRHPFHAVGFMVYNTL